MTVELFTMILQASSWEVTSDLQVASSIVVTATVSGMMLFAAVTGAAYCSYGRSTTVMFCLYWSVWEASSLVTSLMSILQRMCMILSTL